MKHVQGHQKEQNPHSKLDGWAIMNDEMDRVAKAYLHHTKSLAPLDHIINSGEWAVWIQRNKIMSNLKHFLVQAIQRQLVVHEWTKPLMRHGRIVRAPRFSITQLDIMDEPYIHAAWKQIKGYMC